MKLTLTEKRKRRSIYVLISLLIICITPLCEKGRILSGASNRNAFAGEELTCAIELGDDMYGAHGLKAGFSYELINRFAEDNRCSINVVFSRPGESYLDSLKHGSVDILITSWSDDLINEGMNARQLDRHTAWAVDRGQMEKARIIDIWMSHMKGSHDYDDITGKYYRSYNPHYLADKGVKVSQVSPYDESIRKYADELGWDWRMLAAVVYQESKYSINSVSPRGAKGLMQVMPKTGTYYGVEDLIDPEMNLKAGTNHLKRLQKLFGKYGMEREELIKFTLAAYNAGEGRISECRKYAENMGADSMKWDSIVEIIPQMREENLFNGKETISYIESIMSLYDSICQIHPSI